MTSMNNMKVLVIVDMQNDFIDGALANPAAKAIVPKIVDLINSKKYDRVVFTLDTHTENYLDTVEGKNLPIKHCIVNSNGWELNHDIETAVCKNYSLDKITALAKDTFGAKRLSVCIDDADEIDFVGTCTGICVINNVAIAKAVKPNALITVYEDLCACVTPESHNRAIEQMKFNHINIEKWGK